MVISVSAPVFSLVARSRNARRLARLFLAATTERARAPGFFCELGVPDTIDGRFDLMVLHSWLVLEWLGNSRRELSQAFVDEVFLSFDEALRELGTGDAAMIRKLKSMANAFYGRLTAYRHTTDAAALASAIQRNIYRGDAARTREAQILATYVYAARSHLAQTGAGEGAPHFGPLPGIDSA